MNVTKEQLSQARKIDLLTYMQQCEPDNLLKRGNEYRLREHDSCIISNGLWHWSSQGIGGRSALDYLIKVRGMHLVDATNLILNQSTHAAYTAVPAKIPKQLALSIPATVKLPTRATAYLQQRGIHPDIIRHCIENGTMKETTKYGSCLFLGYDKGVAKFGCVRGTKDTYHGDLKNSDKRFAFCLLSDSKTCHKVSVSEAPIDALSIATIAQIETGDWKNRHYLSLGGTSPLALVQFLKDHPEVDTVNLQLDADGAGQMGVERCCRAILEDDKLERQVKSILTEIPTKGKDYNEHLLNVYPLSKSAREELIL